MPRLRRTRRRWITRDDRSETAGERDFSPIGVVTVDDQPYFRAAARDVIDAVRGFAVAGEAASGEEALRIVGELRPELVLVDVRMPGMDGIETARRIKAAHPDVLVILISVEDATNLPAAAANTGAATLLRKQDFGPSKLRALWTQHRGPG